MKARAVAVAVADEATGHTRLAELRSEPPLLLRPTGPGEVHLVGGAAGPLAGDVLAIDVHVEPGAHLTVRTTAASIALPGRTGEPSRLDIRASVAPGATLHWLPEPLIVAAHAHHETASQVALADPTAAVVWREELFLGRAGEPPGRLSARLDVTVAGRPLLRQALGIGPEHPGWDGPAVIGNAHGLGTLVLAGAHHPFAAECDVLVASGCKRSEAAVLPLDGPGTLVTVLADDAVALRRVLEQAQVRQAPGPHTVISPAKSSRSAVAVSPAWAMTPPSITT